MTNGPQPLPYRANPGRFTSYEVWTDDAACVGSDPAMFELEAPARSMTVPEEDSAHDLIAQGLRICSSCPVKKSCSSAASSDDRYWSTRGGQPPEGLFADSTPPAGVRVRGPLGSHGRKRSKYCPKGHDNWKERPGKGRRCVDCDRLNNRKREAARRAAS